jgi:hypothetical protein
MAKQTILWVEDDYLEDHEDALVAKGYDVDRAYLLSDGARKLAERPYDLLMFDVMMPIERADIEMGFTAEATDRGNCAGIEFYGRYRDELKRRGTAVMVYTILGGNAAVKHDLTELGLPAANFIDKVAASNVNDLIHHVEMAIRNRPRRDAGGKDGAV